MGHTVTIDTMDEYGERSVSTREYDVLHKAIASAIMAHRDCCDGGEYQVLMNVVNDIASTKGSGLSRDSGDTVTRIHEVYDRFISASCVCLDQLEEIRRPLIEASKI